MAIDLNQVAQSFYSMIQQMNETAVNTVGIDAKWCRSIPYQNSEDVILQEYTLLNVECPKDIRIVTNKADWNPGTLQVDLFGINYEAPMEISITIQSWRKVYGTGSQPQKDDIVYIPLVNKLFQVATATVDYGWAEQPTGFKCQLVKYNPHASRRESDGFMESLEDMTVSQERLFGEEISKQIADITDPEQFDATISTSRDPYKTFDMSSIIEEDIMINGNIFSRSHYNFKKAKEIVTYPNISDTDTSHNWRLFTAWLRLGNKVEKFHNITIKDLYNKNKTNWQLRIKTPAELEIGDEIILHRGKNLSIPAIVSDKHDDLYMVDVKTSDALLASKLITNWWEIKGYTIVYNQTCNILSSDSLNIVIKNGKLFVNDLEFGFKFIADTWYFLSLQRNLQTEEIRIYSANDKDKLVEVYHLSQTKAKENFNNSNFSVGNIGIDYDLTNVRYYMTTRKTSIEHIRQDALSRFTRSNSLSIILDNAEIINKETYIGISK